VFIPSFIRISKPDKQQLTLIVLFLQAILRLSIAGIRRLEKQIIELAIAILSNQKQCLFTSTAKDKISETLCKGMIAQNAMTDLSRVMETDAQTLKLFSSVLTLSTILGPFSEDFHGRVHLKQSRNCLQRIITVDPNCDVVILLGCLDELQERLPKKEMTEVMIQEFVRILSQFFDSENFDQRRHSLHAMEKYCQSSLFGRTIARHFSEPGNLASFFTLLQDRFHSEYAIVRSE
jgi:hypothetical protein